MASLSSDDSNTPIANDDDMLQHRYGTVLTAGDDTPDDGGDNGHLYRQPGYWSRASSIAHHIVMFSALSLATYTGVSLRIVLYRLSEWDGVEYFDSLYSQLVGSFIMGALVGYKDVLQNQYTVLYTTLATGLCGSLTTFSSWNAEAALVLLQVNDTSLAPLPDVQHASRAVGFITVVMLGVGAPVSLLLLGRNITSLVKLPKHLTQKHRPGNNLKSCIVGGVCIACYILVTITLVTVGVVTRSYHTMFSLLLGPIGTYIRWCLGSLDKSPSKTLRQFPFGTLIANAGGSAVLAGTLLAAAYFTTETSDIYASLLAGVAIGFCSSLTTVSSFVAQLCALPLPVGGLYAVVSIGVGQVIFIVALGTYSWTIY